MGGEGVARGAGMLACALGEGRDWEGVRVIEGGMIEGALRTVEMTGCGVTGLSNFFFEPPNPKKDMVQT